MAVRVDNRGHDRRRLVDVRSAGRSLTSPFFPTALNVLFSTRNPTFSMTPVADDETRSFVSVAPPAAVPDSAREARREQKRAESDSTQPRARVVVMANLDYGISIFETTLSAVQHAACRFHRVAGVCRKIGEVLVRDRRPSCVVGHQHELIAASGRSQRTFAFVGFSTVIAAAAVSLMLRSTSVRRQPAADTVQLTHGSRDTPQLVASSSPTQGRMLEQRSVQQAGAVTFGHEPDRNDAISFIDFRSRPTRLFPSHGVRHIRLPSGVNVPTRHPCRQETSCPTSIRGLVGTRVVQPAQTTSTARSGVTAMPCDGSAPSGIPICRRQVRILDARSPCAWRNRRRQTR